MATMGAGPRTTAPASVRMAVNLGGLEMKNPVTVASGTFAAGREYGDFVDVASLGAVTTDVYKRQPHGRCPHEGGTRCSRR